MVRLVRIALLSFTSLLVSITRAHAADGGIASKPLEALTDAEFAFVQEVEGHPYWVSRLPWENQALRGRAKLIAQDAAFGRVAEDAMPAALKALVRQRISLFDAEGRELCKATLREWGVLAEFNDAGDTYWKMPRRKVLEKLFSQEPEDARLRYAVKLELPEGCASPAWARASDLPPAQVFAVSTLEGKALAAERPRFRKAADWVDTQQRFAEDHKGRWDEHADTHTSAFTCSVRGERFLLARLSRFEDCESFSAEVVLLYRGRGKQAQELSSSLSGEIEPTMALDLNGDGLPEWFTSDALIGWDGSEYTRVLDNGSVHDSCPC